MNNKMCTTLIEKSYPGVAENIKNDTTNDLQMVHLVLYGETAHKNVVRRNVMKFTGFEAQEEGFARQKKEEILKETSPDHIEKTCKIFNLDIQNVNAENINDVVEELLKLLTSLEKNNSQHASSSVRSNKSTVLSVTLEYERKIIAVQEEILKVQGKILLLEKELIIGKEKNGEDENKEKLVKIEKELLELDLKKLKNKEKLLQLEKNIEFQERKQERSKVAWSGEYDGKTIVNSTEKVRNWLERENDSQSINQSVQEGYIERNHNQACSMTQQSKTVNVCSEGTCTRTNFKNEEIENITLTMKQMLARQAVGKELPEFDGSSCLEWKKFESQYKLSTDLCGLSDQENIWRLQKYLCGNARKCVEILLSTAKSPNEIIEILKKKYSRSELLLTELIRRAKEIPDITSWQLFCEFENSVRNISSAVKEMKCEKYINKQHLLAILIEKLPDHMVMQWGQYLVMKNLSSKNCQMEEFTHWVQNISEAISEITFSSVLKNANEELQNKKENNQVKNLSVDKNSNRRVCSVCHRDDHLLEKCETFINAEVKQRWRFVEKAKACFTCLRWHKGNCKKRFKCNIDGCERYHHKLLHKLIKQTTQSNFAGFASETKNNVLLKFVPIKLRGPLGVEHTVAFLDEGSTVTLIDSTLSEKLGLKGEEKPLCCKWTGETYKYEPNSKSVSVEIGMNARNTSFYKLNNVRTICDLDLPVQSVNADILQIYPFVKTADIDAISNKKPLLLIGQDNANLIVSRQTIQPNPQAPILSRTKIGWTAHGPIHCSHDKQKIDQIFTCCEVNMDNDLHEMIKDYFKIENFGVTVTIQEKRKSVEDTQAIQIAEKTVKKCDKRYEIGLLWKENNINLVDSKNMALQRLKCLERKLFKDKNLAMNYKKEINELLKKGYAFEVPNESLNIKDPKLWFLPHFAIKNPNKPNKTRVVFDAAAKVNGYSLNDYMLPGPDWLSSLVGILIRFREHKVAFSADIKEMFNRINIIDEDCSAQSFLWRDLKINEKPKVYRMKAMLFGMTSSPFLAQFVKNLNAKKYESTMPRAVESIVRNHYVDDCLDGAKSEDEAVKLIEQIVKIHKEGGFELRGFTCNCQEVLDQLPKELVNTNTITSLEQEQRILGLLWNSKEDHFKFNLKFHKVSSAVLNGIKIPTKREVLKVVMSIFDPLGFTSPVTIKGKILLQEIWRSGLGWDDEIKSQMSDKWKQWWKELKFLTLLEIPRCYSTTDNYDNVDLHVFTDASEEAYAAAAYLCFSSANERRLILIAAKARVAPLKTLTIPRLELMAAVLGCRLSDTIVKELSCKIQQKYFWCDSKTILNWIKTEKRLPSFVASRVGEIIETTTVEDWRWIPSTENVADVCTRSKPITDENIWDDWLYGPKFLYTNKNDWTFDKEKYKDDDTNTGPITENVLVVIEQNSYMPKVKCLYHWNRIRRITAWMKRFIDNSELKDEDTLKRKYGCLEVKEIEWAEKQCIKFAQKGSFPVDMMNLQKNELNKGGRLVKLSPKLNEDGIIQLAERFTTFEKPFTAAGVYYFGHFLVKLYRFGDCADNQESAPGAGM